MRDLRERFYAKTQSNPNSGCLLWTGSCLPSGYGKFCLSHGDMQLAHRAAWMIERGLIPLGLWVLHRCDTPPCVNVEHLFLGTHQENMDDMTAKGRHALQQGERAPRAKLTNDDVREIRRRMALGCSQVILAAEYGVSKPIISRINTGRIWGSVV